MNALKNRVKAFVVSEDGPTATEYAVMLALIIVVCIATVKLLGAKVKVAYENVEKEI